MIEDGNTEVYYDHWAAHRLDEVVFWGPEHTKEFCLQRESETAGLLDNVWAEGGLVLDCDKNILLWYGGDDVMHNPFYNKAFGKLILKKWSGWNVRWAIDGQLDIARYIDVPDSEILAPNDDSRCFELPEVQEYEGDRYLDASTLASCNRNGNIVSSLLSCLGIIVEPLANSDPELIFNLVKNSTFTYFPDSAEKYGEWHGLSGGFHLDYDTKTIKIWYSSPEEGALDLLKSNWLDWKVEIDSNFNWHKTILPHWSWQSLNIPTSLDLRITYQSKTGKEEANPLVGIVEHLAKDGHTDIQISEHALKSRSYYSPKKPGIWSRIKSILYKENYHE